MCEMVNYIFMDMRGMKNDIRKLQKVIRKQKKANLAMSLFMIGMALYIQWNDEEWKRANKELKDIKSELEGE